MENQPHLWEAADNLFFTPEQNAQVDTEGKRLGKIATRRPLPEGYTFKHEGAEGLLPSGQLNRVEGSIGGYDFKKDIHAVHITTKPQQYGGGEGWSTPATVSWNTKTGKISWFASQEQHFTPHLLNEANRWSAANGATPPLWSDDMTAASHRVASRHANMFIPPDAKVDEQSLRATNEHAIPFVHRVREHAARLHAETIQSIGARESDERIASVNNDYNELTKHLSSLHQAISQKNLGNIYGHTENASDAASGVGSNDIPDHLTRHWYDLGDQIATLHQGTHSIEDLDEMMKYDYRR